MVVCASCWPRVFFPQLDAPRQAGLQAVLVETQQQVEGRPLRRTQQQSHESRELAVVAVVRMICTHLLAQDDLDLTQADGLGASRDWDESQQVLEEVSETVLEKEWVLRLY